MTGPFWVGSEDLEYVQVGGATISTTTGHFDANYSRCAMLVARNEGMMSIKDYSKSELWFSARVNSTSIAANLDGSEALEFLDADLIPRIRIVGNSAFGSYYMRVEKVDANLDATPIGNAMYWPVSGTSGVLDRVDVHLNMDAAGSMDVYVNGIHVFAFVGDTTTDGVTEIVRHRLGCASFVSSWYWSETFLSDDDTRSKRLKGFSPVANGNANTFDTGSPSASNINEIQVDDTTLNGSSVAGQIDQYTNGAVPTGTLDVIALFISARAQKGASGPSKLAFGVRTAGTNYWGTDQDLDTAWQNHQEKFAVNPNTAVAWLKTEIGAAAGFNVGSKSAA